jgi:dihydropyrimidinase
MTFDTLVHGGTVFLEGRGLQPCGIGIQDGQIAAILAPGERPDADRTIDATDRLVLPGIIDAHVHFGLGSEDDWLTESRAAAIGGVTSVLNYIQSADSYLEAEPREREKAEAQSVIDFVFHLILMNETHLQEVGAYVDALDVHSFKYFSNFKGDEGAYMGVEGTDNGFFFALCRAVAEQEGALLAVHPENIEVVWRLAPELRAAGRDDLAAWTDSRPDFVEAHDMFTAFLFAEQTGCQIYIPHLSNALGLRIHDEHRQRGGRSYIETCTHYLMLTQDSERGTLAKVNPPVRTAADREALWGAVADGRISVLGSDHNSRRRDRKQGSIWKASAGFPGVTTLLPILLDEGHQTRGIPLETLIPAVTSAPARIFGIYPRKGTIAIGSDADLAIVDLERRQTVDGSSYGSHSDYSVYDGLSLQGWPTLTMVRGEVVMEDGEIVAEPGHGRRIRHTRASEAVAGLNR